MRKQSNPLRAFLATLILGVAILLTPITLVVNWLETSIIPQDDFVALYSPVAGKADFQVAVANQVADTAAQAVDSSAVVTGLQSLSQGAAGSIDSVLGSLGIDGRLTEMTDEWGSEFAEGVRQTVLDQALPAARSPQFAVAWTDSLEAVHGQVVTALATGLPTTLTLPAGPYVELLKDSLISQGYRLAELIPAADPDLTIPLVEVQFNEHWATGYQYLAAYGPFLPWVNAGLLLLGVLVANRRMRALAWSALGVAVLAGTLWWAVPYVGNQVVLDVTVGPSQSAAQILWQAGTAPLRAAAALVGIVSAVVAALSGAFQWATQRRTH